MKSEVRLEVRLERPRAPPGQLHLCNGRGGVGGVRDWLLS
jgi:hypothetical protein